MENSAIRVKNYSAPAIPVSQVANVYGLSPEQFHQAVSQYKHRKIRLAMELCEKTRFLNALQLARHSVTFALDGLAGPLESVSMALEGFDSRKTRVSAALVDVANHAQNLIDALSSGNVDRISSVVCKTRSEFPLSRLLKLDPIREAPQVHENQANLATVLHLASKLVA